MKNLILLVIFLSISSQSCFAGLNSSQKEMEYKKKKALSWHDTNLQANNKSAPKEKQFLKDRALRWHGKNNTVFANEINYSKQRSLRWHEANSK